MKRRLRYRLMGMMLLVVVTVILFVGVLLLANVIADYNRVFYEDMEDLTSLIHFFDTKEEEVPSLADVLAEDNLLDPARYDRYYYILKDEQVLYSSDPDWTVERTPNLLAAFEGRPSQKAGLFSNTLDYAYPMQIVGYTFYVLDYRAGLQETLESYGAFFVQTLMLGLLLTVVLSFVFARRFLVPIQRLTDGARKMDANGAFESVAVTTKDEVGELTRVFNEMGIRITENVQMLKALLENIPKPLIALNEEGCRVYSNESFELLFDQPPADLFGGEEGEGRFMASIGERYYCIYRTTLMFNNQKAMLYLLDDITEAEQLEHTRKQFVADVSHELKTPITVIKSYSETLIDGDVEGQTARRFLKVIEKSAEQMNRTVNQLLELIQTEQSPAGAKEPLDFCAALREVGDAMALEMEKKQLALHLEMPQSRILICEADKVRRVMINLLSNSIKYSNPGGNITITVQEVAGGLRMAVADEGIGIEKQHLPFIFDKFYRVDKARSRSTGGTGLGLSIVRAILDGMGGRITVESTPGKGSIFTCYFPD